MLQANTKYCVDFAGSHSSGSSGNQSRITGGGAPDNGGMQASLDPRHGSQHTRHHKPSLLPLPPVGVLPVVRQILAEGGLSAFWKGLLPGLMLVSNPAIQVGRSTEEVLR